MKPQESCRITTSLAVPLAELRFTFSRSSGKGGQHVNKVNSRVTLWFDLEASATFTPVQKQRIRKRLAGRINKQGILQLDADRRRSQGANREDALVRFAALLKAALHVEKPRRKTKPTAGAKKRRLQKKKQRGQLKKQRGKQISRDD
ncbi:MAG: aminoacyl-tRNA hydrolase [Desulfobulbus sp.]|nr:MAG: aminoacyl-tRNA hydrolase [Desulfobulbus sp.]